LCCCCCCCCCFCCYTARSPVYASFSEALSGLDTLRAFGATGRFLAEHRSKTDRNVGCFFHLWMSMCWVTVRLETMGSAVLASVAVVAVLAAKVPDGGGGGGGGGGVAVDPLLLGLALVYALQLTALFQRCVQVFIDTETYMTSVERILELAQAPPEALGGTAHAPSHAPGHAPGHLLAATKEPTQPPALQDCWPTLGALVFEGVKLRYRDGPLVLNGLSLRVAGGTRVGVCGRTGAGKVALQYPDNLFFPGRAEL